MTMDFSACAVFVKDRWSVLESIKGAEQVQGMPEI
jgi:hypothetical protein